VIDRLTVWCRGHRYIRRVPGGRAAGFPLLLIAVLLLVAPLPLHAQFDTRYRWTLSGGAMASAPFDLYDGDVQVFRAGRDGAFHYRMQYAERLSMPLETWLRFELTRNESHFIGLRGRWGRAGSRSSLTGAVAYPSLEGDVSWLRADALAGFASGISGTRLRLYAGASLGSARLSGRPDTVSALAVYSFDPDSVIPVLLPWTDRAVSTRGGLIGAELRIPLDSRFAIALGLEQRIEVVRPARLDELHMGAFRGRGHAISAQYDPYTAFPRTLVLSGEWHLGTRQKADARIAAVAAVRGAGDRDTPDWRDGLPPPIRSALVGGDTAAAVALLEAELVRQPRNPLILGSLGVLLADQAGEAEGDFQQRLRAERLLLDALSLDANNPRYLMGLATVLQKRLMPTDARRVLARAFEATTRRPDQVTAADLADAFYRVALTLEQRVIETEGLRLSMRSVEPGLVQALNYMGPRTREILTSSIPISEPGCELAFCLNWVRPRAFFDEFQEMLDLSASADTLRQELVAAFRQTLDLAPAHAEARRRLMAALVRAGQWEEVLAEAREYQRNRPTDAWAELFLASANYWNYRLELADSLFRSALPRLALEDRRIFQDLGVILPAADEQAWNGMDDAQRAFFRQVYFRMRDPLYITAINEREAEHVARVALAELLFGEPQTGLRGWETDRGQIMIRYGWPRTVWQVSRRDELMIDGSTAEDFFRAAAACLQLTGIDQQDAMVSCWEEVERTLGGGGATGGRWVFWNYHPDMPSFVFEKQLGRATVRHMARSQSQFYAQDLRQDQPVMYDPPFFDAGSLTYQAARFRGRDPERQEVVFYGQAPVAGLATSPTDTVVRGVVLHAGAELVPVARQVERSPIGNGQMNYRLVVSPGTYAYALEAMSANGRTATSSRGRVDIEPVQPGLALSDLLLASYAGPRREVPNPVSARDLDFQPLRCMAVPDHRIVAFVFEVYGLTVRGGSASYRIQLDTGELPPTGVVARLLDRVRQLVGQNVDGRIAFERVVELAADQDRVVDWFELTLPPELDADIIEFGITVTDLATGESARVTRRLRSSGC
jgi:GWxTD domain-containing protein